MSPFSSVLCSFFRPAGALKRQYSQRYTYSMLPQAKSPFRKRMPQMKSAIHRSKALKEIGKRLGNAFRPSDAQARNLQTGDREAHRHAVIVI